MKKVLLSFCLLIISLSAISQNICNDVKMLERHYGNLRYSGVTEKLDEVALQQILNDEQFAMYEKARKQHVASIPLWCVTGVTATVSTASLAVAISGHIYYNNHPEKFGSCGGTSLYGVFYIFSAIGYGISLVPGIPATILTIQSHRNLDDVVESYNANSTEVTLSFGATDNGFGLVLKF